MPRKIIPYNSTLKQLARKLRNESTLGETLLWKEIKNKQFHGYDFHRQKPLLNYIVDLYCYELDLVIEIDGSYHNHIETYELDLLREKELEAYNLTIIRFTEQEVKKDITNVLRTIETYILAYENNAEHTPNPSQEGNYTT
ncbi:endonuclease domain-containing protein [Mucilaginibacter sp. X5P1]|uniref:endonuclease domain-containing protein n=1 Tax=Mucilaginibacter sp. X5P1 TaxID=2723088 RepID=UPI0016081B40|nr:endonuclease domain-containing protein [Mucilaginibacter sp. X5P1]MBB6141619.1 very-short-patch-repair endonuclease [Mucilaginibacter sp. X5P1]